MPLPVAHSLAGGAIYLGLDAEGRMLTWKRLVLALAIANAPDLDFMPGLLVGEPNRYHHGAVHSIAVVVIVSLLAGALAAAGYRWPLRLRGWGRGAAGTGLIVALLLASHILLDALTEDFREPVGIPLLWPLSSQHVQLWPWFPFVERLRGPGAPGEFFASLFTSHNLWAATVEFLTMAPVVLAIGWWRRRSGEGAVADE